MLLQPCWLGGGEARGERVLGCLLRRRRPCGLAGGGAGGKWASW